MRKFGIVHSRYWSWALEHSLDDFSKVLGAYFLSCDHGNSIGCFKCSIAYVSDDLGNPPEGVSKGFANLSETDFLLFCKPSKYVFLPKYLKWNPLQNINQVKGALNIIETLPSSFSNVRKVLEHIEKFTNEKYFNPENKARFETLLKPLANPLQTPCKPIRTIDTDTDTDIDSETEKEIDIKETPVSGTFENKNQDVKNPNFSENITPIFSSINKLCNDILNLPKKNKKFNPRQWAQQKVSGSKHPGAIHKALQGVALYWDTTGDPWGYCEKSIKKYNGNFNEAEAIKIHEGLKAISDNKELLSLTAGLIDKI